MAAIRERLGNARLVTLTGAGGSGKTRLACEVARDLVNDRRDGVWLVELAGLESPDLVLPTAATTMGIRPQPGQGLIDALRTSLQTRQLLLVLDNCEHLIAACAALVESLLQACPRLQVLATSRERLAIAGETVWRVPPLSLPAAAQPSSLTDIAAAEAVRLFVERATASDPDFALTPENADAVVQICRRLDGMPLAIELAAARVPLLPVEQLAARLDDRFHLLVGGNRTSLPRQRTLQATVDWSYGLLSDAERVLFRRLSVAPQSMALDAATAIGCGTWIGRDELLPLLGRLVEMSFTEMRATGGEARYYLLETLRQYGRERLQESGEAAAVRKRHAHHFLALVGRAGPHLNGSGAAPWLDRLERERDHLGAALNWWIECGASDAGRRAIDALWEFWWLRGHWIEGRAWLHRILAERADLPPAMRGELLRREAFLAHRQADDRAARLLAEASVSLQRGREDQAGLAAALHTLGDVVRGQGDDATARALFEESLTRAREQGDQRRIADILASLGRLSETQGDFRAARTHFEECLRLRRAEGNDARIADSLADFANVAKWEGDYASARSLNEESLALARHLGDRAAIAFALRELGILASIGGDDVAAAGLHEQAAVLFRDLGNLHGVAVSLAELGRIGHRAGDDETALDHLRRSVSIFQYLEDETNVAETMLALAAAEPEPQRAAGLLAAARRAVDVTALPVWLETAFRRDADALRRRLGGQAFAAAWDSGWELPLGRAAEIAVRTVAESGPEALGLPGLHEHRAGSAPTPTANSARLSAREGEILRLLAAGKSNREIAEALVLSIRTVETHVARIYQKTGTANRAEASAYAVRQGLA